jgi:sulfotransferase
MLDKQIVYITGLPQSGSTLLCQLLGQHPDIYSTGYSSPLCQTLISLRRHLSDNDYLLAQLDPDFPRVYQRLVNAFRGFIDGWFAETDKPWVVDKNRSWLNHLETVHLLDPKCRMLVCVRELGQICSSIETQHQKTLLLDFPDHLAGLSASERAKKLFADDGRIGAPLKAIESMQDINENIQKHLYYVVFEHLISEPIEAMQGIYQWLGLPSIDVDPHALAIGNHQSNSYDRFKYPHQSYSQIQPPARYQIPPRFDAVLKQTFTWFYESFYPGLL